VARDCRFASRELRIAGAESFEDLRHLSRAQHRVDFRDLLRELVAVPFRQAARDDQPRAFTVALLLRHFQDRIDRFLFG
jgi:hypothetical protein